MPASRSSRQRIADDLRVLINSGELPEGSRLPALPVLEKRYGVAHATAQAAIDILRHEGLVESGAAATGTTVKRKVKRQMITRTRTMQRDDYGYYSSSEIKGWKRIEPNGAARRPITPEVAEYFGVEAGTSTVVRTRLVANPDQLELRHYVESWIHPDIAALIPTVTADTGPGGTLDRVEEYFGEPLAWSEVVTSHPSTPDERQRLLMPVGIPVLQIMRIGTLGSSDRAAMVDYFWMSGELFGVRYQIERSPSARWPVRPAVGKGPISHSAEEV